MGLPVEEQHRLVRVEEEVLCDGAGGEQRGGEGADPVENADQRHLFDLLRLGAFGEVVEPATMSKMSPMVCVDHSCLEWLDGGIYLTY